MEMTWYSIEPKARKYVKGYGFLLFARTFSDKYRKQLLDAGLDALETASKKFSKAAEGTGEFVGNKIPDKIVILKYVIRQNKRNVEKKIIPPEKREEILNNLRIVLQKWNTIKYLSY